MTNAEPGLLVVIIAIAMSFAVEVHVGIVQGILAVENLGLMVLGQAVFDVGRPMTV